MSWLDRQLADDVPAEAAPVEAAPVETEVAAEVKAEEAPKAEAPKAEAPKVEPPKEEKPVHQVPLPELMRERDRRKQAEIERETLKAQVESIRKEIEALRNPPKPEPNKEEDPAAYLEYQQEKLKKELESIKQENEAKARQTDAERKRNEVQGYISRYEADFEKDTADYREALAHLRQKQVDGMIALGADFNTAINQVFQYEFQEAVNAMASGYNPAQMLYNKAKKFGYAKKEAPKEVAPEPSAKDKETVENLDRALKAAQGQGNKGGPAGLKEMLEADDNMFSQIFAQTFGKK